MPLDPANPPIWLRKLDVAAARMSPSDYAPTPAEGIVRGCEFSDAMREFSAACMKAMGRDPLPPHAPFENPFQPNHAVPSLASIAQEDGAAN